MFVQSYATTIIIFNYLYVMALPFLSNSKDNQVRVCRKIKSLANTCSRQGIKFKRREHSLPCSVLRESEKRVLREGVSTSYL